MPRSHRVRTWLSLGLVTGLSGCSFFLDFDDLQKGKSAAGGSPSSGGATANSGGFSNSGGTSGDAGAVSSGGVNDAGMSGGGMSGAGASSAGAGGAEGGVGGSACECTDTDADPCTVARCIDLGNGPECVQAPIEGLVLDREFDPIVAERHLQLSMVAGPSEFYLSSLSATGDASNAVIYRFDARSVTVTPALDLASLKIAGQPVSVPALAVDTTNGLKIHAYVGLRESAGAGARAWHVALNADLEVQAHSPVSTTYALASSLANQTQHPAALSLGAEIWGAWLNGNGTIGITSAGVNPETLEFGSIIAPASSVALLGTRNNRPAALYTVDGVGVFLQTESGVSQIAECQSAAGVYYGTYTAPTSLPGLWALGWTKSGPSFLTTEGTLGLCAANAACAIDPSCDANEDKNLTRNLAAAAQHIQGDPQGVMYYLDVAPTLAPVSSTTFQASVTAFLVRIDFGTSSNLSGVKPPVAVGDPVLLSTQSTSAAAGYRGPDHAASAIIGDVAAVAWVEPTLDGTDRLRVQRYKMCLPQK